MDRFWESILWLLYLSILLWDLYYQQIIIIPNLPDDEWIKPHSKRVVSSLEFSYELTPSPSPSKNAWWYFKSLSVSQYRHTKSSKTTLSTIKSLSRRYGLTNAYQLFNICRDIHQRNKNNIVDSIVIGIWVSYRLSVFDGIE